jgi:hypothetical protein
MQERISASLFPEKVYQLAEKRQVGTPLSMYKARNMVPLVMAFLMMVFMVFLLLWTIRDYLVVKAFQDDFLLHCDCAGVARARLLFANAQRLSTARNQIALPAFFLMMWVGALSWFVSISFSLRIYVCSEGLFRIFGRQVQGFRWHEVTEVAFRGKTRVRFLLADGRTSTWRSWGLAFPEIAREVNNRLRQRENT